MGSIALAAEIAIPGVQVQVLDYIWPSGAQILGWRPDYVLCYQLSPQDVGLEGWIGKSVRELGKLNFTPADMQVITSKTTKADKVRAVRCLFDPDWFSRIWPTSEYGWDRVRLNRCFDMHSMNIGQAMRRLALEAMSPGFASPLLTDSLSQLIAVELARYFHEPPERLRVRTREGKMSTSDIKRIHDYVSNLDNACPDIEEIARFCNISAPHLRRSFKKATGKTVHDLVEEVRMDKVRHLLVETDLPLKEIAYRAGFTSLSAFSSAFKRKTGKNPSEYRHHVRSRH